MNKQPKQKHCAVCQNEFTPRNTLQKVCCASCALDYAQGVKAKEYKKQASAAKRDYYRQDVKWQLKKCQPVFNLLRRLQEIKWYRDCGMEPICISCSGTIGNDEWCNGHFKSVGSSSSLRFDPRNSYLQHNKRCNSALSADINGTPTTHGYKKGLILRFGEKEGQEIIDYCEQNAAAVTRWDWQELESMRKEWNKEIRELKKELGL